MIRLPEVSLQGRTLASLQVLQDRVDGAGDYAARVAQAKIRWDAKPAPVFRTVKDKLTEMCSGVRRCCYCEDSLADEVEHIKLFRDRDDLAAARAAAYRDYLAHLRGYIKRRDEGACADELRRLRDDLLHRQHPSVWRAMQRQPNSRPELAQAFAETPEALEWR